MRFILRTGTEPTARADAALLAAMGLPGGGVVRLGRTHALVAPGDVASPNTLVADERTISNAGLATGGAVDVARAVLPQALRVTVSGDVPLDGRHLGRALHGRPVTSGDRVVVRGSYGSDGAPGQFELVVVGVEPGGAGMVGDGTAIDAPDRGGVDTAGSTERPAAEAPSSAEALLAGLDTELEVLTGWLSLLTGSADLPASWGLPAVAGVVLEGPSGCGKSELVAAAAAACGAAVREVSLDLVFKAERVLEVLERAVRESSPPTVVFIDHLDAVAGPDGMFRTQVAAIMRWFLDAVAARQRVACVLGTASVARLQPGIADSPLLPRTLAVPPPDLQRRALLFRAAMARVPSNDIGYDQLAARTAGFSAADIVSAVLHASAMVAAGGGAVTMDHLEAAVRDTTPSLGTASLGEMPSYGFERVADLVDVKQRLTESVIWQMTEPERFARLRIEPPRGMLLHGPPGTGKTFVIRALAHEAGAAFFTVKGAELLDKWVGESERAVREVFARARMVAPAILFFDEIDALAPVRGNSTNSVTDSVVAALLTEMDGINERGDVFVIGATNRIDLVDPALLRPGRLETHLFLGLPAVEARRAFFEISDVPFAADVDLDQLVAATDGASFADLSGLLREAALQALRRDGSALAVTAADLAHALAARERHEMPS